MDKEELRKMFEKFTGEKDFVLNPDKNHVDMIIDGLLENERKCGLRLCPCRVGDGTKEGNLKLMCPCNFKAQENWERKGECWCGLFVKKY